MKKLIISICSFVLLSISAVAQNLLTFTLPEGNTILQLSGADAISTTGGTATPDLRTIYFLQDDFGDPQPNDHDWTINTAWPYVYVTGAVNVDAQISANISTFDDGDAGTGDVLLVDGNPVYQFVNDSSATDANGNFGPWFFIEPDGSATQAVVPEPAFYTAFLGFVALLAVCRINRRK